MNKGWKEMRELAVWVSGRRPFQAKRGVGIVGICEQQQEGWYSGSTCIKERVVVKVASKILRAQIA